MGIDAHGLRFLEHARRVNGPLGATLTVGHQGLHLSERELQRYLGTAPTASAAACFRSAYVDDLLVKEFGATSVASVDASDYEKATYLRDLNLELEPDFPQFDTVVDAGSLEHVFDVRVSFGNIGRCCRVGGQILHMLPANNFVGHGFYQFSPEFFFSLYSTARGFSETEVYLADLGKLDCWWQVLPAAGRTRSTVMSARETYVLVRTAKTSAPTLTQPVQQSDYLGWWETGTGEDTPRHRQRSTLGRLTDHLPGQTKAILLEHLRGPAMTQAKRRFATGLHARNAALRRVAVPSPR
jgi:SAM-dependent methyltransferase